MCKITAILGDNRRLPKKPGDFLVPAARGIPGKREVRGAGEARALKKPVEKETKRPRNKPRPFCFYEDVIMKNLYAIVEEAATGRTFYLPCKVGTTTPYSSYYKQYL